MKVLITGGSGLLGQYLNIALSAGHDILTLYNGMPGNCGDYNSLQLNLTDYADFEKVFTKFYPDVVLHTAAISNPEKADAKSADFVYEINVNVTQFIAELCQKFDVKLIYTSTDSVYAGYRGSMLKEDAKLIPISLYAETKLMGEEKIKEVLKDYVILRTSLLYGIGLNSRLNNFHKMYFALQQGGAVPLFTDQYRTPLSLIDAARLINELITKDIEGEIINFGGREKFSRYELGEILCEEAGFDKNLLIPKTMDEMKGIYKIADVSMNTDKLQSYGLKQKGVRESIREILKAL